MSKKTELVQAILKFRNKENDIAEAKHLYSLTNSQLIKIYNSENRKNNKQEILRDFEAMGYKIFQTDWEIEMFNKEMDIIIYIDLENREYSKRNSRFLSIDLRMQEHKLLNELFKIWGWL